MSQPAKGAGEVRQCAYCKAEIEGRSVRCDKCRVVPYCSREHQRSHWPEHKTTCKKNGGAAASTAPTQSVEAQALPAPASAPTSFEPGAIAALAATAPAATPSSAAPARNTSGASSTGGVTTSGATSTVAPSSTPFTFDAGSGFTMGVAASSSSSDDESGDSGKSKAAPLPVAPAPFAFGSSSASSSSSSSSTTSTAAPMQSATSAAKPTAASASASAAPRASSSSSASGPIPAPGGAYFPIAPGLTQGLLAAAVAQTAARLPNAPAGTIADPYATEQRSSCGHCNALLLGSALSRCAACKLVAYCGRDCQRAHWKASHKANCGKPIPAAIAPRRDAPSVASSPLPIELWAHCLSFLGLWQGAQAALTSHVLRCASLLPSAATHMQLQLRHRGACAKLNAHTLAHAKNVRWGSEDDASGDGLSVAALPPLMPFLERLELHVSLPKTNEQVTAVCGWLGQVGARLQHLSLPTGLIDSCGAALPGALLAMPNLRTLLMPGCTIDERVLEVLPQLQHLRELAMPSHAIPAEAREVTPLLIFATCLTPEWKERAKPIMLRALQRLADMESLQALELTHTPVPIGPTSPSKFEHLPNPPTFTLAQLLAGPVWKSLRWLSLQHQVNTTDSLTELEHMGSHFPRLHSFTLRLRIRASAEVTILPRTPRLVQLEDIARRELFRALERCFASLQPRLRHVRIDVQDCPPLGHPEENVREASLIRAAKWNELPWWDKAVEAEPQFVLMLKAAPHLRSFNLRTMFIGTREPILTRASLRALVSCMPRLSRLDVLLDPNDIENLVELAPLHSLQVLSLRMQQMAAQWRDRQPSSAPAGFLPSPRPLPLLVLKKNLHNVVQHALRYLPPVERLVYVWPQVSMEALLCYSSFLILAFRPVDAQRPGSMLSLGAGTWMAMQDERVETEVQSVGEAHWDRIKAMPGVVEESLESATKEMKKDVLAAKKVLKEDSKPAPRAKAPHAAAAGAASAASSSSSATAAAETRPWWAPSALYLGSATLPMYLSVRSWLCVRSDRVLRLRDVADQATITRARFVFDEATPRRLPEEVSAASLLSLDDEASIRGGRRPEDWLEQHVADK